MNPAESIAGLWKAWRRAWKIVKFGKNDIAIHCALGSGRYSDDAAKFDGWVCSCGAQLAAAEKDDGPPKCIRVAPGWI